LARKYIGLQCYLIRYFKKYSQVLWVEEKGCWFDWDLKNHKHRDYFYVSNIVPLWTGSYMIQKENVASSVLRYLEGEHIIQKDFTVQYEGEINIQQYYNCEKNNNFNF